MTPPPPPEPAGAAGTTPTEEGVESPPTEPAPAPEEAPDGLQLAALAEDRLDQGDTAGARAALVAAAAAHRSAGNLDAALDACYTALGVAPADPELHLLLTRLYLDRGWRTPATEKLRLLDRLTGLSGDRAARKEIRRIVAELANEPDEIGVPG
jgi:hypothetical protein